MLRCHSALVIMIKEEGDNNANWLPDCSDDNEIRKFCKKCVAEFKKIALSCKNGKREMPEDRDLADAVRMYLSDEECQSSDQFYPSDRVPAKLKNPYLVKMYLN